MDQIEKVQQATCQESFFQLSNKTPLQKVPNAEDCIQVMLIKKKRKASLATQTNKWIVVRFSWRFQPLLRLWRWITCFCQISHSYSISNSPAGLGHKTNTNAYYEPADIGKGIRVESCDLLKVERQYTTDELTFQNRSIFIFKVQMSLWCIYSSLLS